MIEIIVYCAKFNTAYTKLLYRKISDSEDYVKTI